jgi:Leucine-rich repeat (LRR) protein
MSDIQLLIRRIKRSNETKLDLAGKSITFLPAEVYTLEQLEVLDLSNNKITSIDPKIVQLTKLKILDLSKNNILSLPQQIIDL